MLHALRPQCSRQSLWSDPFVEWLGAGVRCASKRSEGLMGPVMGPRGFAVGVVWTACNASDFGNDITPAERDAGRVIGKTVYRYECQTNRVPQKVDGLQILVPFYQGLSSPCPEPASDRSGSQRACFASGAWGGGAASGAFSCQERATVLVLIGQDIITSSDLVLNSHQRPGITCQHQRPG